MPVNLKGRSFLTLMDFTPGEIRYLLEGEEYLVEYIGTAEEIPAVTVRWCVSQVLQLYMV